jgi:GT2 family glycosyltransferase
MQISIVIVNRNSEFFADKLMESTIRSCKNCEKIEGCKCREIIVVDNASTYNSLKIFEKYSKKITEPLIKIVRLHRNAGFCYAANVGVMLANTELVAILNPDLYVDIDWLIPIIEDFVRMPRLGVVQPLIYWYQDPERIQSTGLYADFVGNYKSNAFNSKTLLAPFGAAYVVRRSAFVEIGGLDPLYFMYGDELDLGLRMWLAGWTVMLEPRSKVYHYMGGVTPSSAYLRNLKCMLMRRNQIIALMKSLSLKSLSIAIPLLTFVNVLRGLKSKEALRTILIAYHRVLRSMQYIIMQRRRYSKRKILREGRLYHWGLIRPVIEIKKS